MLVNTASCMNVVPSAYTKLKVYYTQFIESLWGQSSTVALVNNIDSVVVYAAMVTISRI